jgi:hypothetical protein
MSAINWNIEAAERADLDGRHADSQRHRNNITSLHQSIRIIVSEANRRMFDAQTSHKRHAIK